MPKENKIIDFLFEIASLRRITRHDRQVIQGEDSNIADHSFRASVIGMILANLEKCDENKVMKMCLFHDVAETRIGDANFINKQYVDIHENEARIDQMKNLPIEKEVSELFKEYNDNKSIEAMTSHDADTIDQMILQQEYFHRDPRNAKIWHSHSIKSLRTESAKKLAERIKESDPMEWFYRFAEEKAGEKIEK